MHFLKAACSCHLKVCWLCSFCLQQPSGHSSSGWLLFFIRTQLTHQLPHEDLFKPQSTDHARCLSSKLLITVGLPLSQRWSQGCHCILFIVMPHYVKSCFKTISMFLSLISDLVVGLICSKSLIIMCWWCVLWPILSHSWVLNLNMTLTKRPSLTFQFTLVSCDTHTIFIKIVSI